MNTPFFDLGRRESVLNKAASFAEKKIPIHIIGPSEAQRAHLVYYICETLSSGGIVITQTDAGARQLALDIAFFTPNAKHIPASEFMLYQTAASSKEARNRKISELSSVTERTIAVMSVETLLQFVPDHRAYVNSLINLSVGEQVDTQKLPELLTSLGYTRYDVTESVGQFSIRGGILDIYLPTQDLPIRIEFFGDEVDSVRSFDPQTQVSIEKIETTTIPPMQSTADEEGSILSYFSKEIPVFFDEPHAISGRASSLKAGLEESLKHLIESGAIENPKDRYMHEFDEIMQEIKSHACVSFANLSAHAECIAPQAILRMPVLTRSSYRMSPEQIKNDLCGFLNEGKGVVLLVKNLTTAQELASLYDGFGIKCSALEAVTRLPDSGELIISVGALSCGFVYTESATAVLTMGAVGEALKPRKIRSKKNLVKDYSELNPGDHVVHRKYGIGRYEGIERIEIDGIIKDYAKIQYRGTDVLYLPASSLDSLSRYMSGKDEDKEVRLSKLGGTEWANSKARVKSRVREMAVDLVRLYAERKATPGFAFSKDTVWQSEFEDSFPYEPTQDQLRCTYEIKHDMEKPYPMDRLLLGDVGFGKTEVAARAAFKAVMDSKQVAILCPTTILAMQHYNTFCARMENYPINIEMISRFRTKKEQEEIIKKLHKGDIDIIIGTHRIVQKDIIFKDLGLLIIDEEQRFGVAHKEKIKELQKNVDVLTLSATPIPRSLNMSLLGIRDISIISEPPVDRFPVQTFVMEYNEAVVCDAIIRELDRGGQVYYLHNRVDSIYKTAERLQKAIPDAKISVGHGKMTEIELENVMTAFINGDSNVLVCTTIIETGLDIQNVNTIIIEDADYYGLSQLYQLRGRVGRTNRLGYAFLTYRQGKVLQEISEKRLRAMREYTEFGSGFKIAMRDLQLRGAGDLLGAEQHGFIASIGYETYCEILEKTIAEVKGETPEKPEELDVLINLNINAFIPKNYINASVFIMELYRRIAEIRTESDADEMIDELIDRFGDPPKETMDLIEVAVIRGMAMKCGIFEIKQIDGEVHIKFKDPDDEMLRKHILLATANKKTLRLGKEETPSLIIRKDTVKTKDLLKYLKNLLKHLQSE